MCSADDHRPINEAALRVQNLRFSYPARRRQSARLALDGVSFQLDAGDTLAMLGPNASGKSTLMRLVCGLLPTERGQISVFGTSDPHRIRTMLGVVFQHVALDPHMTVFENLRDQASLFGLSGSTARDRIDAELEAAGLGERRESPVKTLSGGLRRRVDLCRALLHHPRLLLLDEPTVGLDPLARASFLDEIERRRDDHHLTIVMSTHLIDEADRQDRVVLLHRGRIVADGPPATLRHGLGERVLTVLEPGFAPPENDRAGWSSRRGGWSYRSDEDADAASRLAADLAARGISFSIAPPTLADVFEQRTGAILEGDEAVGGPVRTEALT